MARSGTGPSIVIDNKNLSPHNAARHALLPEAINKDSTWFGSKARALALAINGLGQDSSYFDADVTQAVHDSKLLKKHRRRRAIFAKCWAFRPVILQKLLSIADVFFK